MRHAKENISEDGQEGCFPACRAVVATARVSHSGLIGRQTNGLTWQRYEEYLNLVKDNVAFLGKKFHQASDIQDSYFHAR